MMVADIMSRAATFWLAMSLVLISACSPSDEPRPANTEPVPPSSTPTVVATEPGLADSPVSSLATSDSTATRRFDYWSVATEVAATDTPLGHITWLRTSSVPGAWIDAGFPSPANLHDYGVSEYEFEEAAASAPCCLDVYPTPEGWIGLGTNPAKANRKPALDNCPSNVWHEVWFSPDGATWAQMTNEGFGPDGIDPCSDRPFVSAGLERSIIVQNPPVGLLQENHASDPDPRWLVWVSDDLTNWSRGIVDLHIPGMQSVITAVIATSRGWAIFGMRVALEPTDRSPSGIPLGPHPVAWFASASTDGVTWHPLDIAAIIDEPWCEPPGPHPCGSIDATTTHDAIVAYVYQWSNEFQQGPTDGWTLWIGTFAED